MEEQEKKAQEMYMEFQALEQYIKQMQRQLEVITQQLMELAVTNSSLDEFDKMKAGKEVLIPLSSGIFAKGAIADTSELLVNVGANTVVTKNVPATKKLILSQIEEMKLVQKKMVDELERMAGRAAQIEGELQGIMPKE